MDRPQAARAARPPVPSRVLTMPLPRMRVRIPARAPARGPGRGRWAGVEPRMLGRALRAHRRLRIAIICTVIAAPLLGGGWMWFRGSSFVSAEHVSVTGVHGPQAGAIAAALEQAGRGMSTLAVSSARLKSAVAAYPSVAGLKVTSSFPHGLHVTVLQREAVAALVVGGTRTAVSADGIVLGPGLLSASLPTVAAVHEPAGGGRVTGTPQLAELAVLGAAPAALAGRVQSVYTGPRGLTVAMRNGLLVYFGDASRPHAKWLSLARVLAETSSQGAVYVDVRLPSRPAAGFPEGAAPTFSASESQSSSEAPLGNGETPVGALSRWLAAANPNAGKKATGEPETGSESKEEAHTSTEAGASSSEASSGTEAAAEGGH
ncbi:MAG TPA: cell division protein FtsQ/DivIB [Solirubrobacteraceae bacterium]|nr:cell division protein FtsQ/DivIB [Solirubrobacteraceae bacterium]